jgi:hypothetical protein
MSLERPASRLLRPLLLALLLATCARAWLGPVPWVPRAQAQLPDSARQRVELLTETRRTNDLLRELIQVLRTQTIKVALEGSDKPGMTLPGVPGGPAPAAPPQTGP